MADQSVADIPRDQLEDQNALWGPYWSDKDTGVIIFIDNGENISFVRTVNGGASWGVVIRIELGTSMHMAAWYDKETPGDSGTLVHIAWLNRALQDAKYVTVDVADGSIGTIRTVDGNITAHTAPSANRVAITKTINGNIIVAFSTLTEIGCVKSADGFATAGTVIADVAEAATEKDWVLLFPADVDAGDACALYIDQSANLISLKMYDDSANSWTEMAIAAMNWDVVYMEMDGAIRHSDGHLLLAFHSARASASDDLQTFDLTVNSIAAPTVTAKADVFTNQNQASQVAVFINQNTDDVYIAYLKGGAWLDTVDVVFHISDDGMGSWGGEQAYSESAADDFRLVSAGRTVGDAEGRFQPSFFDDDDLHIYINLTNDIEIAAVVGAEPSQPLHISLVTNVVRVPDKVVGY